MSSSPPISSSSRDTISRTAAPAIDSQASVPVDTPYERPETEVELGRTKDQPVSAPPSAIEGTTVTSGPLAPAHHHHHVLPHTHPHSHPHPHTHSHPRVHSHPHTHTHTRSRPSPSHTHVHAHTVPPGRPHHHHLLPTNNNASPASASGTGDEPNKMMNLHASHSGQGHPHPHSHPASHLFPQPQSTSSSQPGVGGRPSPAPSAHFDPSDPRGKQVPTLNPSRSQGPQHHALPHPGPSVLANPLLAVSSHHQPGMGSYPVSGGDQRQSTIGQGSSSVSGNANAGVSGGMNGQLQGKQQSQNQGQGQGSSQGATVTRRDWERERMKGGQGREKGRHPNQKQPSQQPPPHLNLQQPPPSGTASSTGMIAAQPQPVGPNEMAFVGMQASGAMGPWMAKSAKQIEVDSLPANDRPAYYTSVHGSQANPDHTSAFFPTLQGNRPATGNRGIKHLVGARYIRKNKMFAWSPSWDEDRAERRAKRRLKGLLKYVIETTDEVDDEEGMKQLIPGDEGVDEEAEQERIPTLRHLRESASPPLTGVEVSAEIDLLPMWPPKNAMKTGPDYLELASSPALRNTLGSAGKEVAMLRTVDDLIDGESNFLAVLGKLRAQMAHAGKRPREPIKVVDRESVVGDDTEEGEERDDMRERTVEDVKMDEGDSVATDGRTEATPAAPKPSGATQGLQRTSSSAVPPKPALDSSFLFGTGEPFFVPPGSNVTYEAVDPTTQDPDVMDVYPDIQLTPLQKLFVTSTGLTTTIGPSAADPRLQLPLTHPSYPHTTCVRLTPETQKQSVIAALEKIQELASDCTEYVRRLEESRERIANLGRARQKVWQVVRERAVLAHGGEMNDGEADVETMRLRAEAEHAIAGSGIETRRRRGVATAVASQVMS